MFNRRKSEVTLGPPTPVFHTTLKRKWFSPDATTKTAKPFMEDERRVSAMGDKGRAILDLLTEPRHLWALVGTWRDTASHVPAKVVVHNLDGSRVEYTQGIEEDHTHEVIG